MCQILPNFQDGKPLLGGWERFLKQYQQRFDNQVKNIQSFFTCDMSWPILNIALKVFDSETLPKYTNRSFLIVNGEALKSDLNNSSITPSTFSTL